MVYSEKKNARGLHQLYGCHVCLYEDICPIHWYRIFNQLTFVRQKLNKYVKACSMRDVKPILDLSVKEK